MKKIISLVLAAGLCLSVFASDIFTYAPLKGDVSSYMRTDYSIAARFGNYYRTPSVKYAHNLDADGNDIESTEINAKDVVLNTINSTYDVNGNLLSQTGSDADGQLLWTTENVYKKGLLAETNEYNAKKDLIAKTIYTYSFNRLIDESSYDGDGALTWKTVYTYNDNDQLDAISQYFPTGALSEQSVYEYDENGVIKSITKTDSVSKVALQDVFRYNAAGVLTEVTTYSEDKQITRRVLLKYDANGNVSQVSTYDVAQKFGSIVSELVNMSDFTYKYGSSDDEIVTVVSEK